MAFLNNGTVVAYHKIDYFLENFFVTFISIFDMIVDCLQLDEQVFKFLKQFSI
jgi:hypothetical protein